MKVENLSRVVTFLPKSKIKAGEAKENGKYVFFTSSDSRHLYIDEYLYDDELIVLGTGGFPSCNYYNGKFAVSTDNFVIKTNNNLLPKYLYYFLRKDDLSMLRNGFRGTGLKHISKDYVSNIQIPIIDLKEQKTMVGVLDKLNNSIEGEKQLIVCYDKLIKSRFNEMFSNYKVITRLGDLANICRGASPRPISSFITKDDSGINWIKIGDVDTNAIYITKTEEKITKEGANKSRMVYKGDFILSNSMSFGRPYILGINGCVHDGWLIISNYQKHFEPLFLYYSLRSDDVQSQFEHDASGTTVKNLNSDIVKNTFVITSPLKEQKEFSSFVEHIDKLKFNCQQRIKLYQELLNKKMDEYFG